jgi:hypothetical protein
MEEIEFSSFGIWFKISNKGGIYQAVKRVVGNFCGATVDDRESPTMIESREIMSI